MLARADEMDFAVSAWAWRPPGTPLNGSTPASRRSFALLYAGVAAAGGIAAMAAPTLLGAALAGVASAACLGLAGRAWTDSRRPFYILARDGSRLGLAPCDVLPGNGIGPFELGPPDSRTLAALRSARACWFSYRSVTYLIGNRSAWMALRFRTDEEPSDTEPPSPGRLGELVMVETSHPFHATPEGVAPGMHAREVTARLGPPLDTTHPVWGDVRLHYRGLVVTLRRGRVRSLRVITADPLGAAAPWLL